MKLTENELRALQSACESRIEALKAHRRKIRNWKDSSPVDFEDIKTGENFWQTLSQKLAEMGKIEVSEKPSAPWEHENCTDPIHQWFNLSYANYLVVPRTLLQSLSRETQLALCRALEMAYKEEAAHCEHHWPHEATIEVKLKDVAMGRFVTDPLANYERGRRRLW